MQMLKRRSDAIYLTEMGAFIARRITRPAGNASAIYSRTRASLTALSHLESNFIASA
ncbi:hypothetical protein [Enterobacter hormaechei]|uniref:hypothetical protein n=1 Tax=Enterobacter hormaechei TaxID=158836 RepID=UPI003CF75690